MNREQLVHAIRVACEIIESDSIIVIGSQSILGSFDEDDLPAEATASREVDMLPQSSTPEGQKELAELISGVAGEMSLFDDQHGFYLDGVDDTTAILPPGWQDRLVAFPHDGHRSVLTNARCIGWCLDPHDLCVAKLCAHREKDIRFVQTIIDAELVDAALVRSRLRSLPPLHAATVALAETFIRWPGGAV